MGGFSDPNKIDCKSMKGINLGVRCYTGESAMMMIIQMMLIDDDDNDDSDDDDVQF